ncbi:MAG: hypothetical protein K0U60_06480 [Actinomycetia bacterium]|nr:hypothetical protein [Actinomycetes bacterium]MCH9801441.1 hypothetical protein [Actinomycetes bacterium]
MSSAAPESQPDRTRLSWRRTLILLITVAGIGSYHMIAQGNIVEATLAALLCLACAIPIYRRQLVLRKSNRVATWEPVALSLGVLLLAAAAAFFG